MSSSSALPLAVTMGDPAGIGGDVSLMCWHQREALGLSTFLLLDDPARLKALATKLGLDVEVAAVGSAQEAAEIFPRALPVMALSNLVSETASDAVAALATIESMDKAVALAMEGSVCAVVTNPIHKARLYKAGFQHPGHTEYLGAKAAEYTGVFSRPVMMLACDELRVVPITIHTSLRQAIDDLTTELIVDTALICAADLKSRFGLKSPRLAFAGLNPHAGEDGNLGREEIDIIAPALEILRRQGIDCLGPFSADTMFHHAARNTYDVALCMYHDQALIPIKTIDFDHGVNVTLGLSFIRTSPDHGTAFDIQGTGKARPDSLAAALKMASEMATISTRNDNV